METNTKIAGWRYWRGRKKRISGGFCPATHKNCGGMGLRKTPDTNQWPANTYAYMCMCTHAQTGA